MDLQSSEVNNCIRTLKEFDFELAYLTLLTAQGIKPLSRWEKTLDYKMLVLLQQIDLQTAQISRSVRSGNRLTETIFSKSPAYLNLYSRRFADAPIDKSPDSQRLEGYLFGYPSCCIEQYIRHPYTPNNLPPEDQKILFHWVCKNCRITPLLLPIYKAAHRTVENL